MAHVPPDQLHPNLRVFRLAPNGRDLSEIPHAIWHQIAGHERPLQPANGSVKLLLISGRGRHCEAVDALRLQTDDFGFLLTWDASGSFTGPPSSEQVTPIGTLVDARHRFLRRYIAHRHSWKPAAALLVQVLALAGYSDTELTP